MWDIINTVIFSWGLGQFFASLIPVNDSRLGGDPVQTGFPLRYLLTGGHPFLSPIFFLLIFGLIYLEFPPQIIVSYSVKAGGIGGIIFSVLAILVFARQWYKRMGAFDGEGLGEAEETNRKTT